MELHMNENYRVNLSVFEGPLDLLLYLIKKNDLDVYDIPVSLMLDKYMEYLDSLRELDIDLAGEFLLMAAELAHIKSRLLLPQDEGAIEEDEADPRADLVRRLLEYQQYRLAAETLEKRTQLGCDVFVPLQPERVEAAEGPLEADVFELMTAFGRILKRIPADQYHAVAVDRISVNARILQLTERIKKDVTITLEELLVIPMTKYDMVVTFLAVLEMSRLKMIKVYQSERYGPLYVRGRMEEVTEEEVLRLVQMDDEGESHGTF